MPNIAILASGAGSNAREIIRHFQNHPSISIALVGCNKQGAGVISIANEAWIPVLMLERDRFLHGDAYLPEFRSVGIDFIVLAGFLWKVPEILIAAYPRRIINIHPALLPDYGGKGMYGSKVHEAVIRDGRNQSGITIHYVDEHYDHGDVIFQAFCEVAPDDTPSHLAEKIHRLEHEHFPKVVQQLVDRL